MNSILEISELTKIYPMAGEAIYALNSISISVSKGEFISLMGPSGSGKSTFMNMIGCLDTPTSGSYKINGKNVSNLADDDLSEIRNKEIGFIFQSFNLLPRYSALDNVALPLLYSGCNKAKRREKAYIALKEMNLESRANHKPGELSGGQRQRVAIARALVNNPSIILADEPTGNLDTKTSLEIMDIFQELYKKGHTIIMVTHEEEIAKFGKRIIKMRDGRIELDSSN